MLFRSDGGTYEVGEECLGEVEGDGDVEVVLEGLAEADVFFGFLFSWRTFEEAFDGAVEELEVDGLGAHPAAPDSSEEGGDEEDGEEHHDHEEAEEEGVLGEECFAEEDELSVHDVEEDGGLGIDFDDWEEGVGEDEEVCDDAAVLPEVSGGESWLEPAAGAVVVEG